MCTVWLMSLICPHMFRCSGVSVHRRTWQSTDAHSLRICPRPRLSATIYDPWQIEAGVFDVCTHIQVISHLAASLFKYKLVCVLVIDCWKPAADVRWNPEAREFCRGEERCSHINSSVSIHMYITDLSSSFSTFLLHLFLWCLFARLFLFRRPLFPSSVLCLLV